MQMNLIEYLKCIFCHFEFFTWQLQLLFHKRQLLSPNQPCRFLRISPASTEAINGKRQSHQSKTWFMVEVWSLFSTIYGRRPEKIFLSVVSPRGKKGPFTRCAEKTPQGEGKECIQIIITIIFLTQINFQSCDYFHKLSKMIPLDPNC